MSASNAIRKILSELTCSETPLVYFVVNVRGQTHEKDYQGHVDSILTEYLKESEYDDIITSFKQNKFRLKVFYNEIDFIKFAISNKEELEQERPIVFNLGRNGKGLNKKTIIPSFCNLNDILITGSGAYHVALGRHKYHVNSLLRSHDIPVAQSWLYTPNGWFMGKTPPKGLRVISKPVYESASRGVSQDSIWHMDTAMEENLSSLCKLYEQNIIVQEFIPGYEVGVPIVICDGYHPLLAVGVSMESNLMMGDNIITFEDAFNETYTFYDFDQTNPDLSKKIKQSAVDAAICLGLEQYCRIDFRIRHDGSYYITDTSTHPFLIKHSAFAFAFEALGFTFSDIFAYLILQRKQHPELLLN